MSEKLKNARRELFCIEYLKDLNAAQAAIRSGYNVKRARQTGYDLLRKPEIKERIALLKAERLDQAGIDADYVLNRLLEIDRLNIQDLLDDNGDLKDVKDWSQEWQTSIQALDIQVSTSGGIKALTKKIRIPDRLKNLEMLGKHIDVSAFKERAEGRKKGSAANIVIQVSSENAQEELNRLEDRLKEN